MASNFTDLLYKADTKGKIRTWQIEYTDEAYRTHSGILHGKVVISGWKYPEQKNVGRSNETTIAEQVRLDVASAVERQTYQGKYHTTIATVDEGAKFLEPMLAHKYDSKKTVVPANGFISQPKLDGIRCLVKRDGSMQSRNGKPILSAPHVALQLADWFEQNPDVIALDGELYNHDLKADFEKIVSLARKAKPTGDDLAESAEKIQFHAYDVITGKSKGYPDRIRILERLEGKFPSVKVVPSALVMTKAAIEEKLGQYLELGYEGGMLRDPDYAYEHKRSKSLLKHKEFVDEEVEIVEIIEGVGNWAGYAKAVKIKRASGVIQQSGMRGTQDYAAYLLSKADQLVGTQATVRAQGETADGKLRFPVIVFFWEGDRDL